VATFCLVHGAWHGPDCWGQLAPRLEERGHEVLTPDLPLHDPTAGFAERVRPALEALDGVDDPLVIVGHSQGTAYSCLLAAERPEALLVYLCPRLNGFEPPAGAPTMFREGFPFPADRPDGTSVWDADAAIGAMYSRVPPDTARSLAQHLRPMAMAQDDYPLDAPPGNESVLVYAAEDEFFQPDWSRFMARELLDVEPIEIPGGHFPMAEDPEGLAELLDRLPRG
jgi:pimeloyl-ACP methyl ester carboxylesterase